MRTQMGVRCWMCFFSRVCKTSACNRVRTIYAPNQRTRRNIPNENQGLQSCLRTRGEDPILAYQCICNSGNLWNRLPLVRVPCIGKRGHILASIATLYTAPCNSPHSLWYTTKMRREVSLQIFYFSYTTSNYKFRTPVDLHYIVHQHYDHLLGLGLCYQTLNFLRFTVIIQHRVVASPSGEEISHGLSTSPCHEIQQGIMTTRLTV